MPFFYGWVIVAIGFLTTFFGIGLTWAASVFAVPMRDELGWSRSEIFFAVSVRGWMGILVTPLISRYLDERSGVRVLTLAGGVLNTVSLVLISQADEQWQFLLLFGVIGGIAQTAQSGISVAVVPKWFITKRASAVLYSTLGGGLAALTLPLFLAPLDEEIGWRGGWLVVGVLAFVLATLPTLLLRRQPEDLGLLPDGRATEPGRDTPRATEVSFTRQQAMSTRAFWLLMVGVAFGSLACNGVPTQVTNMFTDRGFSLQTASTALVAYGFASIGARIVWARVVDRHHLRTVLMVLAAYGVVALPVFIVIPDAIGYVGLGYGALVGFFVGAYIPLHGLVWAVYFGRAQVGAISGAARPLGMVFLAGGPFLLASTRDVFGSYDVGLLLLSASLLVCLVCLYLARPVAAPGEAEAG